MHALIERQWLYNALLSVISMYMYSFEDIKGRSESENELVVDYSDAMGGWLKYANGQLGHCQKYQGITDLSAMPNTSAIALITSTIMQAHTEWQEKPEARNVSLLFCIDAKT